MKLQHLIIVFIIIMLPLVLILSQYVGIQIDAISTKTKYDSALLGATYDTMAAYEINTRNISASSVVGEDIREIEAVISTFTRSLSSSIGLTGIADDYILSYIPAIVFCMYDGYYIYMPNERSAGSERLQPYVYYAKNYTNGTNTNITIAYSLDNYVTLYGKYNGDTISAAGYLINPEDVSIDKFAYVATSAEDGGTKYKVLSGKVTYKGIDINKETTYENKTIKDTESIVEKEEESTDAMMYYYQAFKFTEKYNNVIDTLKLEDKEKLLISSYNDPEDEDSAFNNEKVAVIKDAITSNLNRAIYNFEGGEEETLEMPQLNEEDWNKILNNISIIAFMKDIPLNRFTTYNNYVIVNSTITQKFTNAKSINFIGYDENYKSKGYYHKISCENFLNDIQKNNISNIIGYPAADFERLKGAVESKENFYYYYKHNEYADYNCQVKSKENVNIATLHSYLTNNGYDVEIAKKIEKAYYTAIGRIRYRQIKASSYINLENEETNNFNVIYKSKEGYWSGGSTEKSTNSKFSKTEILREKPIRIGYEFYGYKINNSTYSTGEIARPGDILYSNYNVTLDAYYNKQYTIEYRNGSNIFKTQTKLSGIDLELLKDIPERSNYQFLGWAVEENGPVMYSISNYGHWITTEDKDLTLYSVFSEKTYKVQLFNGTVDNKNIEYVRGGDTYTIKTADERIGYEFLGWSTSSTGNVNYSPNSSITNVSSNIALFAKWKTKEYKIIFNFNGGNLNGNTSVYNVAAKIGEIVDISSTIPKRENYAFAGWAKTLNGDIDEELNNKFLFINEGFINKNFAANTEIIVYAVWTSQYWNVTYKSDSDTRNIPGPTQGIYNLNTSRYEMTISSQIPEKENHEFINWKGSDGSIYEPGKTYGYNTAQSNIELTAQWERTKVNVTYYSDNTKTKSKTYRNVDINGFSLKSQYEFTEGHKTIIRWKDLSTGKEYEPYASINKNELNRDFEFVAIWGSIEYNESEYIIEYHGNADGDAVWNLPYTQYALKGTKLVIQGNSPIPERSGYTFKGWTDVYGGTTTKSEYNVGEEVSRQDNLDLYAVWERIQYNITFDNTTNGVSGLPSNKKVNAGDSLTLNESPTRTNYTFKGWRDENGNTYNPGATIWPNNNMTLYAIWERIVYTISYNKNTTSSVSGMPNNQKVNAGENTTISGSPTRTNYTFKGWSTTSTGSVEYTSNTTITPTSNMTLYAVWERVVYTISYNKNTTSSVSGMPNNQKVNAGESTTISGSPSRNGYTFKGWAKTSTGSVEYTLNATITPTSNITLYAIWERNPVWHTCNSCDGDGKIECSSCDGTGKVSYSNTVDCGKCSGTGKVTCTAYEEIGGYTFNLTCPSCRKKTFTSYTSLYCRACNKSGGRGGKCSSCGYSFTTFTHNKVTCSNCSGTGTVTESGKKDCGTCSASGYVKCTNCSGNGGWWE